jgi:hypothetical protein
MSAVKFLYSSKYSLYNVFCKFVHIVNMKMECIISEQDLLLAYQYIDFCDDAKYDAKCILLAVFLYFECYLS